MHRESRSGGWSSVQGDWETPLHGVAWGQGYDNRHMMKRLWHLPAEIISQGPRGRVLDVAAAQAVHSSAIANRGFSCVALEPAPSMLADARKTIADAAADVSLVRGIAESLPFGDRSFDQVICHSAIDHFAEPDRCIREMARVLKSDGRLVLTFVNYGSISTRLSRMFYRLDGLFRRQPRIPHWFWESPVPHEHSFECTLPVLAQMCEQYLSFEGASGISVGWQMPGWGWLLNRFTWERSAGVLERLDRLGARFPAAADVVVATWKPRPRSAWKVRMPGSSAGSASSATNGAIDSLRVTAADPVYKRLAADEARYRPNFASLPGFEPVLEGLWRMSNRYTTGDPGRSWLDDLAERAPSGRTAILGLDGTNELLAWRRLRPDDPIDVFDLSPQSVEQARRALAEASLDRGVRFQTADLNFLSLPSDTYDLIWSSGCIHHVINLEHLLDNLRQALRRRGIFALHDYVGECRRQLSADHLAVANRLLRATPENLRRDVSAELSAPDPEGLSPFCAVRSVEIPALIHQRFATVHEADSGYLFPLELHLDIAKIEAGEPHRIAQLMDAEAAQQTAPGALPSTLYGVYTREIAD